MESKETHTHTHVQIKGVRRSEAVVFETLKKRSHCNTARSKRVYCILYIIYIVFLEAEDIGPIPPHDLWEHHLPRALRNNPLIHLSTHPQVASEGTEPTSQKPGKQTTTLFHFVGEIIYLQKYTCIHIHKKSESSRISRAESIVYCSSLLAFASEKSKSQDHSIMLKKVLSPSLSLSPSACSTHDSASTYCHLCYSSSAASIYDLIRKRASSSRNEKCFHIWIFESVQYWVAQLFHTTQKHSRGSRWFTGNSKTLWTV